VSNGEQEAHQEAPESALCKLMVCSTTALAIALEILRAKKNLCHLDIQQQCANFILLVLYIFIKMKKYLLLDLLEGCWNL
jgi:hypothetical protein